MGYTSLVGMMEMQNNIRDTLAWHLNSNMYPPVPTVMIDVCVEAIDAMNAGELSRIDLPEGVTWRGQTDVPADIVMDEFRLWPFVEQEEF